VNADPIAEMNRLAAAAGIQPKQEERRLYAVACERVIKLPDGKTTIIPEIVHLHAVDEPNARWVFYNDPVHRKHYRIVAVGPVIGYHVDDEHGEVLRA